MSTVSPRHVPVRPRGRPCKSSTGTVDSERRKQIRDAQRAYRLRQQSLLASLKERNAQLEDIVGQLCQVMHSFHETKTSPALPPSNLPEAVQLLENEISQQLKRAEGSSLDVSHRPQRALGFQAKMQQLLVQPPSDPTKAVCVRPSIPRQSDSPFWASFLQTSHPLIPSSVTHQNVFDSLTPMENSCDRPIPYATTPFTQKLFQACAESGHRYLTNDTVTDHEMWNEFGLMLQKVPRAQIVAYFKRVLAVKPCNPVEDLQFPFISLGGAGTHFPRAKQMSIGRSGLQNLLPFQTTNGIKEILSDEEWFDVHDVEGLLSSQNILLNTDRSHPMKSTLLDNHELSPLAMNNMESSHSNCEAVTDGQPGFFEQCISPNPAMSIDEDVIISELSRLCICIGCAAAFRRRDVEALISHIIQPPSTINLASINLNV